MAKSTVQVADRHLGDRRPADTIPIGDPAEGVSLGIVLGGLHEAAHDLPVFTRDKREREAAPLEDESVGHSRLLHRDGEVLRVQRDLHGPVQGHQVAALTGAAPEQVQAGRQLPEHAAAQPVVMLRVEVFAAMDRPGRRGCSRSNRSRAKGVIARSRSRPLDLEARGTARSSSPFSGPRPRRGYGWPCRETRHRAQSSPTRR